MKTSQVYCEIKEEFKCDPKKFFELFRESKRQQKIEYLSTPTTGGGIVAVNEASDPSPMRVPGDIVDENPGSCTATGTLTMFCCQNCEHFALTCFHVGCATDEQRFCAAFNQQQLSDIQKNVKAYQSFAQQLKYRYKEKFERVDESDDENDDENDDDQNGDDQNGDDQNGVRLGSHG